MEVPVGEHVAEAVLPDLVVVPVVEEGQELVPVGRAVLVLLLVEALAGTKDDLNANMRSPSIELLLLYCVYLNVCYPKVFAPRFDKYLDQDKERPRF